MNNKDEFSMAMRKKLAIPSLLVFALLASQVFADDREQAKRIHDRLVGTPPSAAMLDRMEWAVTNCGANVAAMWAMDGAPSANNCSSTATDVPASGDFYSVTLKNWAMPWTNRDFNAFAPLNDYVATVIGIIRDEVDFREILYGDLLYVGAGGVPAYSNLNNAHYEALESIHANLGDSSVLVQTTQSGTTGIPSSAAAGVWTTRAAARAFFINGTNRAQFRYTLVNHFCTDLEQLKDPSRPSDRIRQDVSRSPGGDSNLFFSQCVACHSGMDPMAQAFAHYNFVYPTEAAQPGLTQEQREDLGQLDYNSGAVQPKYLINSGNFPYGYVTPNDHWTNYWRLGDNSARIGWLDPASNSGSIDLGNNPAYAEGDGAASLGEEMANTEAFASCQVKKAFITVCLREPTAADAIAAGGVGDIVTNFKSGYNMKQVFADVASYCSAHL